MSRDHADGVNRDEADSVGRDQAHEVGPEVGLCSTCVFVRRIENRRGTTFYLCDRSRDDARFPRYPSLPVLECPGFVETDPPSHS